MSETTPKPPNTESVGNVDAEVDREIAAALGDQSIEQLMAAAETPEPPSRVGDEAKPAGDNADGAPDDKSTTGEAEDPEHVNLELKRGRISKVHGEDVFVDVAGIDGKLQGVVALRQFDRPPRVGSIMDFVLDRVDETEGLIHLSREGAVGAIAWDQMGKGTNVEARVTATNKGGLELELAGGIHGFMPASQVDIGHVDDLESFVGQKLTATIRELHRRSKRVVLSRRQYLEHQRERQREKLIKQLEVGQTCEGTVSRVVDFGAFIDLGGVDGMVHISDLSYSHVQNPADVVKPGEKVTVKVLKIDDGGKRIRLSLKQTTPDPWEAVAAKYHEGEEVTARIVRLADFGAFAEIEPGIDALLPVSEISWKRISKPSQVCHEGDMLKVKILHIDLERRRMSVSLKQAQGDPWSDAQSKYDRDTLVEATVVQTTDFGAFVEIETGLEGLVHISELADRHVQSVDEVLKVGDRKQFRVLSINPTDRKISLSLKAVDHPRTPPQERSAATARDDRSAKPKQKQHDPSLKGGMGKSGAMGTGLGDLKL